MSTFPIGTPETGEHRELVALRVGKYGPFLEQGERKAGVPDSLPPDELTLDLAVELLDQAQVGEEPIGFWPETERPVYVKSGRFGPYVQLGAVEEGEKPKNAGLLRGMQVEDINLDVALKLLSLPRTVGVHPEQEEPIVAYNGKFGPYIKCGSETRSLPEEMSPLEVSLDQSVHLLAQPKTRGRGRAAPKEPIKVFDESPVTGEPIKLLEGRYGPYVTDGTTNASIPKGSDVESVSFDEAVHLLAERAAKVGTKKKAARKSTKKKAAKKKTVKKKSAKKKAAKKKAKKTTAKRATAKKTVPSNVESNNDDSVPFDTDD